MKIYIEVIILLNFLLDYMILYGTKRLLKRNISNKRILLGSLFGSLTIFLLKIKSNKLIKIGMKIGIGILMNQITFGRKNTLKNSFYFFQLCIILGGSIYLISRNKSFYQNMISLLLLSPIIIIGYIKEIQKEKLNIQNKYQVEITWNHKIYQLEGFIDTGNYLKDPITKKNIIIVNLKINPKKIIWIPYKALNTEGIIPCIKAEKIRINEKEITNCLIGLAEDKLNIKNYNCILPNQLREELC